jgi:hypothetical protein
MKKTHKKSKTAERATGRRSLHAVVVPKRERVQVLSGALGKIADTLCAVGIGHVRLGILATEMLRHNIPDITK